VHRPWPISRCKTAGRSCRRWLARFGVGIFSREHAAVTAHISCDPLSRGRCCRDVRRRTRCCPPADCVGDVSSERITNSSPRSYRTRSQGKHDCQNKREPQRSGADLSPGCCGAQPAGAPSACRYKAPVPFHQFAQISLAERGLMICARIDAGAVCAGAAAGCCASPEKTSKRESYNSGERVSYRLLARKNPG